MVCEVAEGFDFDFDNSPIKLALKDGFLSTDELTTLGADNGIGVAMMMSILDDETAVHPPLEMVFTVEEETTFKGAYTIDAVSYTHLDVYKRQTYLMPLPVHMDGMVCRLLILKLEAL